MPLALILSSFVAASRIGGAAQQYVLAAHKIDPVLAPTAMFGRSPAKGGKGQVTDPDAYRRMLSDIEADAVFGLVDLILTGHFSSPEQVEIAAELLTRVRQARAVSQRPDRPALVVDPIMGDVSKGLYVASAVADRLIARLVPLADYITPNLWELDLIAGRSLDTPQDVRDAARRLGRPALVTSVPVGDEEIGLVYADETDAGLFAHRRLPRSPDGTGDLTAASFGAGLIAGKSPLQAAEAAARAAAEAVQAAITWRADELPIVALADRLVRPTAQVRIERL